MKKIIPILLFFLIPICSFSQNNKVVLHIGAGANYYSSGDLNNLSQTNYSATRLSYHLTGAIGIDTYTDEHEQKNTFAAFGEFGTVSDNLANLYVNDQNSSLTVDNANNSSDYQSLEFGAIIRKTLRISFGKGWFNFYETNEKFKTLEYYSITGGLLVPLKTTYISLNLNAMGGRDFENYVYRPSVSFVFRLD